MICLSDAIKAWGTERFSAVLKREIEQLPANALPLQAGLAASSYVLDSNGVTAMVIKTTEHEGKLRATVGVFYSGILGGCACADDPPVNENAEYCVLAVAIDRRTGEAAFTLVNE